MEGSVKDEVLEVDDMGDDEAQSLVPNVTKNHEQDLKKRTLEPSSDESNEDCNVGGCRTLWRWRAFRLVVVWNLVLLMAAVAVWAVSSRRHVRKIGSNSSSWTVSRGHRYPQFTCPAVVETAQDYHEEHFQHWYLNDSERISQNLTDFLAHYRDTAFDGWQKPYHELKEGLSWWKKTYYASNLKNGDTVFESACGIGLNLFMTLEILQEAGLRDVHVYGNEYIATSAHDAQNILQILAPTVGAQVGTICPADSTHLQYLPAEAFDLVYTGYLYTLIDPLELHLSERDSMLRLYELCTQTDWESVKLNEIVQQRQNDWYAQWVHEMIRIAKPGAPVAIEQVSPPFCENTEAWGGVPRSFWREAIEQYGWDIDPHSIVLEDDPLYSQRYHVFMRKNPSKS